MNPIRTGFNSTHWIKLMESSEYKQLSIAIDNDNQESMMHIYNALSAITDGDTATATSEAYNAVQAAGVRNTNKYDVDCPYCGGSGILEIEYAPKRDPEMTKTIQATCAACSGSGKMNVSILFNDQMVGTYPENGVAALIRHDFEGANKIAKAIFSHIHASDYEVKQKSMDSHFMQ